jgi:hypothetical protein
LPDPVAAGLSLQIILRVPVAVVDDDGVGGHQVDAETSGFGAQQEDKSVEKKEKEKKVNLELNFRIFQTLSPT